MLKQINEIPYFKCVASKKARSLQPVDNVLVHFNAILFFHSMHDVLSYHTLNNSAHTVGFMYFCRKQNYWQAFFTIAVYECVSVCMCAVHFRSQLVHSTLYSFICCGLCLRIDICIAHEFPSILHRSMPYCAKHRLPSTVFIRFIVRVLSWKLNLHWWILDFSFHGQKSINTLATYDDNIRLYRVKSDVFKVKTHAVFAFHARF